MKTKFCFRCLKRKPLEMFTPDKRTLSGLSDTCNDCKNPEYRKCRICGEVKKCEDFSWRNRTRNIRQTMCKKCLAAYLKKTRGDNYRIYQREFMRKYRSKKLVEVDKK